MSGEGSYWIIRDSVLPLLLRFEARGRSRGVDIGFLSLYPREKEFLYPALTGLILLTDPFIAAPEDEKEKLLSQRKSSYCIYDVRPMK